MNHWNLFKESWRIFWRNRTLWIFGLLAALGGGYNLRYNFNFDFNPNQNLELYNRGFGQQWQELLDTNRAMFNQIFGQIFNSQTIGLLIAIGIVWMIIAFLLVTYANGALIKMVDAIGNGEKVSVGFGFRAGAKRFLHLLAVRFILALPLLILGLISAVAFSQLAFNPDDSLGSNLAVSRTFTAIAGLGALAFVVSLLTMAIGISAERAVVLDELPIWPSIVKGWKLLWSKFGDYFIIVILMVGLAIVAGIVFFCMLAPIMCGVAGMGAFSAFSDNGVNVFTRVLVFTGPLIVAVVLASLLFGTLTNTFTSGVWTLAYREWNKSVPPAATALQPVAPPSEPIQPIESTPSEPANNQS